MTSGVALGRWLLIAGAGGFVLCRAQSWVVHARLMSEQGFGPLTQVEIPLVACAVLGTVLLRVRPRGDRGGFCWNGGAAAAATVSWWLAVRLQWAAVIARDTDRDPWNHDITQVELLLLVLAVVMVAVALTRGLARRRDPLDVRR